MGSLPDHDGLAIPFDLADELDACDRTQRHIKFQINISVAKIQY